MRWKRRGFRRGTFLKPQEQNRAIFKNNSDKQPKLPVSWEELYRKIKPMLRPNFRAKTENVSELYRSLSQEEQKNLTHKIAGQILFAHSDIVKEILQRLSEISLDLSQKTEVEYRRLRLVEHFF